MLALLGLPSLITPFLSAALGFAGWFLKEMWEGLKDIFDNLSTILTVATLISIAVLYGYTSHGGCNSASLHSKIEAGKIWLDPFKPDG